MKQKTTIYACALLLTFMGLFSTVMAQNKTVTGKVTDAKTNAGIEGAMVKAKKATATATTGADGSFSIVVPEATTSLMVQIKGYDNQTLAIGANNEVMVALESNAASASNNDVVVIGYGSARKKDLTGAVGSVGAKDFNRGVVTSPDQLIQGKVAGVQVITNSGAPGAAVTVRIRGASSIRGGNSPLFVVDGVILDSRSSKPGLNVSDLNNSPEGNPLNFLNPDDIASMDVLKDASAAAIYGSRGANGVVIITTKKGSNGAPKLDFGFSYGVSSIAKRLKVLTGAEYRAALTAYGQPLTNDKGANVDAFDEITRVAPTSKINVAFSSGNENAKTRISLSVLDQQGFIDKTSFKKYTAGLNSSYKFLESKKLGVDFNVITSQTDENIAPITNDGGAKGSLIGMALQWNPTKPFRNATTGALNIDIGGDQINPVAMIDAYNDRNKTTAVVASIAPSYKITKDLEYKVLLSVNYNASVRKSFVRNTINLDGIQRTASDLNGVASIGNGELLTKQVTHTLSYNKSLTSKVALNAVAGYEFQRYDFNGSATSAKDFENYGDIPYYNYMQFSNPAKRTFTSFAEPTVDLQSYFARGIFNIDGKYSITGTVRADGSSKFGANNKYGFFPSIAGAWNIGNEKFFKVKSLSNFKLRASYGITGNQEFPAGASRGLYSFGQNSIQQFSFGNPDLKWESTNTANFGIDGTIANKINFNIDIFSRVTNDLIFPVELADPVPAGSAVTWKNIPGKIKNSGVEINLNGNVVRKKDFTLDLGVNVTFLKNKLTDFLYEIRTGAVGGQGLSGAFAQLLKNDQPLNVFYLKKYQGIDKASGIANYQDGDAKFFVGSPNPTMLLGININASYKALTFACNFNGAFGHMIYNNTANATVSLNNLKSDRNVAKSLIGTGTGETLANPTSASTRYLEKGDYVKLGNATLSYSLGPIKKIAKSANVFITGQNLFVITKYTGFDPEVNTNKGIGNIPSFGMEYTPYPAARIINFGVNFSF